MHFNRNFLKDLAAFIKILGCVLKISYALPVNSVFHVESILASDLSVEFKCRVYKVEALFRFCNVPKWELSSFHTARPGDVISAVTNIPFKLANLTSFNKIGFHVLFIRNSTLRSRKVMKLQ